MTDQPWNHFINRLAQCDYECRLYTSRLRFWRLISTLVEYIVAACVTSGTVRIAVNGLKSDWASIEFAWHVVFFIATLCAVAKPLVTHRIKNLEKIERALNDALTRLKGVLDDANYEKTTATAWITKCKKATRHYSELQIEHEAFNLKDQQTAQSETHSVYSQYFG